MRKCLLIGASGFLGTHLLNLGPDWQVTGTGNSSLRPGLRHLELRSRLSIASCLRDCTPDAVIFAAGITSTETCSLSPRQAEEINHLAPLEIMRQTNARFLYISTDYVFDGLSGNYSEDALTNPLSSYGQTKLDGERAVLSAHSQNLVVRVSGLYSCTGTKEGLFDELSNGHSCADDDRISSPVHVEDVRQALMILLNQPDGGIFHAGGPHALSRYEFRQIAFLHGAALSPALPRASHGVLGERTKPSNSSLSSERLMTLGWKPLRCADRCLAKRDRGKISATWESQLHDIDAILLDCVGGLLGQRQWLSPDDVIARIDLDCESVLSGEIFWREATAKTGVSCRQTLQNRIASRYAPNPQIWKAIPMLQSKSHIALTNNGPAATFNIWVDKYGLDRAFSLLANSEELACRKPDARFFLDVADRLGARPERCLVVDDNATYIEGARLCGMRVIQTRMKQDDIVSRYYLPAPH